MPNLMSCVNLWEALGLTYEILLDYEAKLYRVKSRFLLCSSDRHHRIAALRLYSNVTAVSWAGTTELHKTKGSRGSSSIPAGGRTWYWTWTMISTAAWPHYFGSFLFAYILHSNLQYCRKILKQWLCYWADESKVRFSSMQQRWQREHPRTPWHWHIQHCIIRMPPRCWHPFGQNKCKDENVTLTPQTLHMFFPRRSKGLIIRISATTVTKILENILPLNHQWTLNANESQSQSHHHQKFV